MSEPLWCTPLLHPAHIARGRWNLEEAQEHALQRLVETVKAGREPVRWDITLAPGGAWLYPSLPQLVEWKADLEAGGFDAIGHDLETAGDHIICDGLTPYNLESGQLGRPLCLRFRLREGRRYWPNPRDHRTAVEFLAWTLDDPAFTNIFHNGVSFDLPLLVLHGFRVRGPIVDTMVLSSRAYAEMPKGLQFLATRYLWAPVWKRLVQPEEDQEGKA